jgi:NhaP-type Na+/H+ or K+/H+ antiporter
MAEILMLVASLLGVGFLSTRLARLLRCPHSVFLVALGLLAGTLWRLSHGGHAFALDEFPDIVLYVLLPPLIFESGYHLDVHELRLDLLAVSSLATVGLFASTALVGAGLHYGVGISWGSALLFGALISATDPVAVVALFREVGAPRRLATLVEGESLFNDATAIVLFRVLAAAGAVSLGGGLLSFIGVTLGGIAVGAVFVVLASLALRWTSESAPAQVGITVCVAYLSFLVADHVLHASGVMATLVVSLYLGHRARLELNAEALHSMHALWEFLALSANTVVFLAVGLSVDADALAADARLIPLTLAVVYGARLVTVFGTIMPLQLLGWIRPIRRAYLAVLAWGGLRGGLALALVLLLPPSFADRSLFLTLASAVVLATLLCNALTTAPLMTRLGLRDLSAAEQVFYRRSLVQVFEEVFSRLREAAGANCLNQELVDEMMRRAFEGLGMRRQDEQFQRQSVIFDVQQALMAEQHIYNVQLERRVLSMPAYVTLTRTVSQRLERLRETGADSLVVWKLDLPPTPQAATSIEPLQLRLEMLLQLELALRYVLRRTQSAATPVLEQWVDTAVEAVVDFYARHPDLSVAVQTRFIADVVAQSARQALDEMFAADVISGTVHAHAREGIERIHADLLREAARRFNPTVHDTLRMVPMLASLPPDALKQLERGVVRCTLQPPHELQREAAPSMYVVLRGELEDEGGERFGAGQVIGLNGHGTVRPRVESEVLVISHELLEELVRHWPQLRDELSVCREQDQPAQQQEGDTGP